ncbi:uncharacterized protein LOC122649647 [Telopea speciosissima]|uniref:uncharacterized protein LOC122649647 n=1 Tax=Telopea speciosissima TaxID=54955 RepID=UPI001CC3AF9A|nr:uncharacterized protein LOC122649647 [Telopea speciosissima]
MVGDFNSYLSWTEKSGGKQYQHRDCNIFQQFISDCNLMDLGYQGPPYTWSNKRTGSDLIRVRLDRGFANASWIQDFPDYAVLNKAALGSDHSPLCIDTFGCIPKKARPFRFEDMWFTHPDCGKRLIEELSALQSQSNFSTFKEAEIIKELEKALHQNELFWKQKSKIDWLREGDRNSKFFHMMTMKRRHRNRILKLKYPDGQWTSSDDEVQQLLCNYFKDLYTADPINMQAISEVTQGIQPLITQEIMPSVKSQILRK